jgi:hypothetical protein
VEVIKKKKKATRIRWTDGFAEDMKKTGMRSCPIVAMEKDYIGSQVSERKEKDEEEKKKNLRKYELKPIHELSSEKDKMLPKSFVIYDVMVRNNI